MLAFWLNYERQNRDVLQLGRFTAHEPNYLYPILAASNDAEEIIGVYQNDKLVNLDFSKRKNSVINACWQNSLLLNTQGGDRRVRVYNCTGELLSDKIINLKPGIIEIEAPRSGLVVLSERA